MNTDKREEVRGLSPAGLSQLAGGPGQEEEEPAKEMEKQQQGRRRREPGECGVLGAKGSRQALHEAWPDQLC